MLLVGAIINCMKLFFRFSAASLISNISEVSRNSSRQTSLNLDCQNLTINYLTLEALSKFFQSKNNLTLFIIFYVWSANSKYLIQELLGNGYESYVIVKTKKFVGIFSISMTFWLQIDSSQNVGLKIFKAMQV